MRVVLSVVILAAFAFLGLVVLPALAEFRLRRPGRQDEGDVPDASEDDGPVLAAA